MNDESERIPNSARFNCQDETEYKSMYYVLTTGGFIRAR
jgi:hypothetical protein